MRAMHDSSPSLFLPTWCFSRLRRQAPIIVHSVRSLPPRFPALRAMPARACSGRTRRPAPSAGAPTVRPSLCWVFSFAPALGIREDPAGLLADPPPTGIPLRLAPPTGAASTSSRTWRAGSQSRSLAAVVSCPARWGRRASRSAGMFRQTSVRILSPKTLLTWSPLEAL